MALIQAKDGDRASYPEIVDELSRHGGNTKVDSLELLRRMVFKVGLAVAKWREVCKAIGWNRRQIERLESGFENTDSVMVLKMATSNDIAGDGYEIDD